MNAINWFEIPATDISRAREFYSHLIGAPLEVQNFGRNDMFFFPNDPAKGGVGGAVVTDPRMAPSARGTIVYLAASHFGGGLDGALGRVPAGGGEVVLPRTDIGEHGVIALFKDSEGNVVGLHAQS